MSNIFVDIESQRTDDSAVIKRLQDAVKPPGQYKKPESIAQWYASEGTAARLEAVNRTALDGTYGRLATIGYAIDDDEPVILSCESTAETIVLQTFALIMSGPAKSLIAFNGEFDFRFLMKRYVINNLPVPYQIQRALTSKDGFYDPMRAWEGYKGYISQQELERVLGIERVDDIDGSQVSEAIDAGDWARVLKHNHEDLVCLRAIYKRMNQ